MCRRRRRRHHRRRSRHSVPPFSLPLGDRRSSFEPITQPRSSYHNQPCRLSNLGSAKLCSEHNVAKSCPAALRCAQPAFLFFFFNTHKSKERSVCVCVWRRRQTEGWREGRIVFTHLHTCLWGSSTNLGEDGCVGGSVTILGNMVSKTRQAFISCWKPSVILSHTFSLRLSASCPEVEPHPLINNNRH